MTSQTPVPGGQVANSALPGASPVGSGPPEARLPSPSAGGTARRSRWAAWTAFVAALTFTAVLLVYGLGSGRLIVTAAGLAVAIGSTILFLGAILLSTDPDHHSERLQQYLRDEDRLPSLSRVQFFTWTCVVLYALAWVTLIRILYGEPAFSGSFSTDVPANLLAVMGLSTASAVAAAAITNPGTTQVSAGTLTKLGWAAILYEPTKDGRMLPSLGRLQMLGWTVVSVAFFLGLLFTRVHQVWVSGSASSLGLPDLDPTLLVLMGISQVGFVGAKYASASKNQ